MMAAKTTHVIPKKGRWIVKKSSGSAAGVFATKKEATDEARRIAKSGKAGQVVIHGSDGMFRAEALHGLPKVQTPPRESRLGKKAIKRAVSKVVRARLTGV